MNSTTDTREKGKLTYKEVGEYMKSMRESLGWNEQQMADALGETATIIRRMEHGCNTGYDIEMLTSVKEELKKRRGKSA